MNIDILSGHLRKFVSDTKCRSTIISVKLERTYERDDDKVRIPLDRLSTDDLESLQEWLQAGVKKSSALLGPLRKINTYTKLKADPAKGSVKTLESLAAALKSYISPCPHKWIFTENSDGQVIPWYVEEIVFSPHNREERMPNTRMSLCALSHGSNVNSSVTWSRKDLEVENNVAKLLERKGYFLETPEAVSLHREDSDRYGQWQSQTGEQFLAEGQGEICEGRWSDRHTSMTRNGLPTKVVMDDLFRDDDERRRPSSDDGIASTKFWTDKTGQNDDDDDEISEEEAVALPLHPYVKVFDLEKHLYVNIHIHNLRPYKYDQSVADKLVLPAEVKDLVHILVQGSVDLLDDIVKGKTGGTIVIATGPPGTGKTLTAEVFSETIARPLYVVQCSQLGTDEEVLENRLAQVLTQATRWKAILLIDEADVYIHERGSDVQQNAIVGVFLRVLEYYRGILFMTSNRATIIDDAIMSRATAWIRYNNPTPQESLKIWTILAEQFKIPLTDGTLASLVSQPFGPVSGRNIKNLLKLAKRLSTAKKTTVDLPLLQQAARFLDLGDSTRDSPE